LIVSNSVYQWVVDLQEAFLEVDSTLKKKGVFCFTMFGQKSLDELHEALRSTWGGDDVEFSIQRPHEKDVVYEQMKRSGFHNIEMKTEIIKGHFKDMFDLVRWLKEIGANANKKNLYIGKNRLRTANDYYNRNFRDNGSVVASFEIVWINAIKK